MTTQRETTAEQLEFDFLTYHSFSQAQYKTLAIAWGSLRETLWGPDYAANRQAIHKYVKLMNGKQLREWYCAIYEQVLNGRIRMTNEEIDDLLDAVARPIPNDEAQGYDRV